MLTYNRHPSFLTEREWVLVDLDGTVSDPTHRLSLLQAEKVDWSAYSARCIDDEPIPGAIKLVQLLHKHYNICLLSGRNDTAEDETVTWLFEHAVPWDALKLREPGNYTNNGPYKADFARRMGGVHGWKIKLMVDDHAGVEEHLAPLNIPCLLVQPPDKVVPAMTQLMMSKEGKS